VTAIKRLLENYTRQLKLPWASNLAGKQRVWFAIYSPDEERRIRAHLPAFEAATHAEKHGWHEVDLTHVFPEWLESHEFREEYFREPQYLSVDSELEDRAVALIRETCLHPDCKDSDVVVVKGLSSLFDYIRVSSVIEQVEDSIRGRLLVLFPGEYAGNVYRFMDARDGFNYMAVPITSTESFLKP
jgi:Domain of unknown function (DUF1788)